MKFEKINSDKFAAFRGSEISNLQNIVGGYTGETSTDTQSDQIQANGAVAFTNNGQGPKNDGFRNY